jgi:hypothetical protein
MPFGGWSALEKIILTYVLYAELWLSTAQIDPGHILLQIHALNKPLIVLRGIARYFGPSSSILI